MCCVRRATLSSALDDGRREGTSGSLSSASRAPRIPGDTGWHIEGSYAVGGEYWTNVYSRERALLMLVLLADVGQAKITGFLEDVASLADGLLTLYEVTGEPRWFESARRLCEDTVERYYELVSGAHLAG
jgi:hypothetical protein